MAPLTGKEQLEIVHKDLSNIKGSVKALQVRVETLLGAINDGGLNTNIQEKFGLIEGAIDGLSQSLTSNALDVRLESRLNNLVIINKLPLEIFTYIILLANKPITTKWKTHPYLSYTWVCRQWRTVLLQNPIFWTLIQPLPHRGTVRRTPISEEFYYELFQRTAKSSKLDVIIASHQSHSSLKLKLEKLFAKKGRRIRKLWLWDNDEDLIHLVLSARRLSSLRGFALEGKSQSLPRLLPIFTTSDHLETFHCHLHPSQKLTNANKDQLASIFSHIRNLSLILYSSGLVQLVLVSLHNSTRLQSLRFNFAKVVDLSDQIGFEFIFPELQSFSVSSSQESYLMDNICAPKLSSLKTFLLFPTATLNSHIMRGFDFLSINYLWIQNESRRNGVCSVSILGTKERTHSERLFSRDTNILFGDYFVGESPQNYLRLTFSSDSGLALQKALSSVLPQFTNLVELHLELPHMHSVYQKIIPQVPSIQKLFVDTGNGLMSLLRLLGNPSRCPRLTHLYCSEVNYPPRKSYAEFTDDVGRSLTNCLISRQDASPNDALKYIVFKNFWIRALPDNWLDELRKLGAEVIIPTRHGISEPY